MLGWRWRWVMTWFGWSSTNDGKWAQKGNLDQAVDPTLPLLIHWNPFLARLKTVCFIHPNSFCEYLMYPNVRMRHWRAQSPEDRAGAFLRGGEPVTPGNILCCNLRFWWVADCYLVLLGVEKKIIIKPEVVSLKYFIHVKFFFLFSNAWRNPWDVQVWNLFLTKWPHMKPDTEGTGSDVELLQVLWQCKEQIWCECGGAQENSAASVHCEFQGLWWLPVINVI